LGDIINNTYILSPLQGVGGYDTFMSCEDLGDEIGDWHLQY